MFKYKIFAYILGFIIKIWFFTIKKKVCLDKKTQEILKDHHYILATWHNQGFSLLQHLSVFLSNKTLKCMVSRSKDGEKLSYLLSFFNIGNIKGSRNYGGTSGFRELLRNVKKNNIVILATDGSTGPLYQVKEGIIKLASLGEIPIIYVFSISNNYYQLKSWDRHIIPRWFSQQTLYYSQPFYVPKKLSNQELETFRLKLQNFMLNNISN